jgi:alpha-L-fucosidase 2
MLVQSQEGYIDFLPALPAQWMSGQFKGLCVRAVAEVGLKWEKGQVKYLSVKATCNNVFRIKFPLGGNQKY